MNEGHGDNNSLFVNVMFFILNCAVLVMAVGKSYRGNFFFFDQYIVTALQKTYGRGRSCSITFFVNELFIPTSAYLCNVLIPTCTILK